MDPVTQATIVLRVSQAETQVLTNVQLVSNVHLGPVSLLYVHQATTKMRPVKTHANCASLAFIVITPWEI